MHVARFSRMHVAFCAQIVLNCSFDDDEILMLQMPLLFELPLRAVRFISQCSYLSRLLMASRLLLLTKMDILRIQYSILRGTSVKIRRYFRTHSTLAVEPLNDYLYIVHKPIKSLRRSPLAQFYSFYCKSTFLGTRPPFCSCYTTTVHP